MYAKGVAIRFKQTMPTDTSAACHLSFASLFFNFFGGACVTPTPRSRLNPLSFPCANVLHPSIYGMGAMLLYDHHHHNK
ncbi:hypothetical protein BLOT_014813 [Blomia tropicalis]|nr:hypothetical protein BLOT_014813 [Blomia tropicalis]